MTAQLARLAHVSTWLASGDDERERTALIERWIDDHESDRLAVFLAAERLYRPGLLLPQRPHVLMRIAPPGCACCLGNVSFRVALVRLLRDARPQQVLIELATREHLDGTLAALRAYEGVLDVRGVLEARPHSINLNDWR